jgi:cytochrome P450
MTAVNSPVPTNAGLSTSLMKTVRSAARLNVAAALHGRGRATRDRAGVTLTGYDPLDPATAANPYPAYRGLHASGRLHYSAKRATWVLCRMDDVRSALRDTDCVSSTLGVTRIRFSAPLLVSTDGDQHAALRKRVLPAFTRGAIESWQQIVEQMASELVDRLLGNPGADVVQELAIPLPMRIIAHILGVPDADIGQFRQWSEHAVQILNVTPNPRTFANTFRSAVAVRGLRGYFLAQFKAGELTGSETLLGRLLEANEEGSLTDEELFLIALLLLMAGNETTTNLLGGLFDTLARLPEQYELIRSEPELVPNAIEEQLRYASPIQNLYRYTIADYAVGEAVIPRGERVMMSFGAANRDPLAFESPDEFRADRNVRAHVAFGHGAHLCLGAQLARLEGQTVLRELTRKVATIHAEGPTIWSTNSSLRGPTQLRVRLVPL